MPIYKIKTKDTVVRTYRVEAATEEEAIDKVLNFEEEGVELWDEYYYGAEVESAYEDKDE